MAWWFKPQLATLLSYVSTGSGHTFSLLLACHPHARHRRNSRLLVLAWPSSHLGNESVHGRWTSLPLSAFRRNKSPPLHPQTHLKILCLISASSLSASGSASLVSGTRKMNHLTKWYKIHFHRTEKEGCVTRQFSLF